jgi:hypothetical protein
MRRSPFWPALAPLVQVSSPPSYQPVACTSEVSKVLALRERRSYETRDGAVPLWLQLRNGCHLDADRRCGGPTVADGRLSLRASGHQRSQGGTTRLVPWDTPDVRGAD